MGGVIGDGTCKLSRCIFENLQNALKAQESPIVPAEDFFEQDEMTVAAEEAANSGASETSMERMFDTISTACRQMISFSRDECEDKCGFQMTS